MSRDHLKRSNQLAVLAVNLLFLMVWGFTGVGKFVAGYPSYWEGTFGKTILATFPGVAASYWSLAVFETVLFCAAAIALIRGEFLGRRPATALIWTLTGSLYTFIALGFGQWLTKEYTGAFNLFMYFCGTLITLNFVQSNSRQDQPR